MDYQLCEQCRRLELSVDKFKIRSGNFPVTGPSLQSLRLTSERFHLGTLDNISTRAASCPLCNIVKLAISPEALSEVDKSQVNCHLAWELDGRDSLEPSSRKQTRRLRIRWDHERLKTFEAYLVLTASSCYDESNLGYRYLLDGKTQFLGRRIGPAVSKRNLVMEFLNLCENNHDERCTRNLVTDDPFSETLNQPYFGVIDVRKQRLVHLPFEKKDGRLIFKAYATVSYVWGNSREHRTTLSNIQDRRKSGGLAHTISVLPMALRQSIDLVSSLGIRYIWIDSICIIQDSGHSWNLNARAMHRIYGNSTITICAADGNSAETGLRALDEDHRVDQKVAKCTPDVHLMLHQPPELSIEHSKWNRRAWTFQERLLSRRCLIFTSNQVYFQCRSTGMSEDIFADKNGKGWSLDLIGAPLQTLTQLERRGLWFFANCVDLYTKRDLFEPFDILAAFSGMCELMEGTLQAPFIFGLPTSHFDFALLWEPIGKSVLLKSPRSRDEKYRNMKFPSWSWCGWRSDGIKYKHALVEGCLVDVHAWLKHHTWIDWHTRDGYGTPQRLWDTKWAQEDESTDERWKGYGGIRKDNSADDMASEASTYSAHTVDARSADEDPENTCVSRGKANRSAASEKARQFVKSHKVTSITGPCLDSAASSTSYFTLASEISRCDPFGRPLDGTNLAGTNLLPKNDFELTLPEYPFQVPKAESEERTGGHREFPDLPVLQFFTWANDFYLFDPESEDDIDVTDETLASSAPLESHAEHDDSGGELRRCRIIDQLGDKCGSIKVDSKWLKKRRPMSKCKFIAISEARSFTLEEMPDWAYYIQKERVESDWDLYFVLLIEHFPQEGIWRRIALGKVFKAAFSHNRNEWKEIILG